MSDVIQNFDRSVAGYEAHSAPQAELAAELARWIAPGERRGRAVEFGAGTGLIHPANATVEWNLPGHRRRAAHGRAWPRALSRRHLENAGCARTRRP